MGHFVTGLVGKPQTLQAFASQHSLHDPVALSSGLYILPLRDEDLDSFLPLPLDGHHKGFAHLSSQLMEALLKASAVGNLVYFETEYHGGTGGQGAVGFSDGKIALEPQWAEFGPINAALQFLGVRTIRPAHDEFETVGLDRHRYTEDWLEIDE
jgi:hypothetical protein